MNTAREFLANFLTQKEAATELKVCNRTLDRCRRLDEGPPKTRLGRPLRRGYARANPIWRGLNPFQTIFPKPGGGRTRQNKGVASSKRSKTPPEGVQRESQPGGTEFCDERRR